MNSSLFNSINGLAGHSHWLDNVMVFSAKYLIFAIAIIFLVCLVLIARRKRWFTIVWVVATLVVSFILLKLAASFFIENRPFIDHAATVVKLIAHQADNSFPSDHATAAFAMAIGLLTFTRYKAVGTVLVVLAALVAFSRVFVGVHYPGDVLGGLVIALIGTGIVWLIKRFIIRSDHEPAV